MRDRDALILVGIGVTVGMMAAPLIMPPRRLRMRHIKFANKVILPAIQEILEGVN